MKTIILLCLLCTSVLAVPRSLTIPSTNNYASLVTSPTGAPYNSITNLRIELRIHNWTQSTGYSHIFRSANFAVRFVANANQIIFTSWPDASTTVTAVITGRTDFIVRFQRDVANSRLDAEIWNVDGSNYVHTSSSHALSTTSMASESFEFGDRYGAPISTSVAYFRLYNTLVPLGTNPSIIHDGNLGDWEFENSITDLSGNGLNQSSITGSLSYADTPLIDPIVSIAGIPGLTGGTLGGQRVGSPITLDASGSYSINDSTIASCLWNITSSNNTTQIITNNNSCSTTVTAYTPGQYSYVLKVTDSAGLSTTRNFGIGAVTSDSNGIVIGIPSTIEEFIGPMLRSGLSPWPWYDIAEKANGDILWNANSIPDDGTILTGTVTLSPCAGCAGEVNPVTMTGSGTAFTTELTAGSSVIWLWWNPVGEVAGSGRQLATVITITDDTHATLSLYYHRLPLGTYTNIQVSKPVSGQLQGWGHEYPNTTNWNFYDNVLAFYRLYYRTGLTKYLTGARTLADRWYIYGLDHFKELGFLWIYKSIVGMAARAADGNSTWWPALSDYLIKRSTFPSSPVSVGYSIDGRERGYELGADAVVAIGDSDPTRRASMCALIVKGINNLLAPAQQADGSWYDDLYSSNTSYPYAGPGSLPWHQAVIAEGLGYAYQALGPNYCNDSTTRATALTVWQKILQFIYTQGRASNRGMFYSINYYANGQPGTWPTGSTTETGTISGSSGTPDIVGVGTSFDTRYSCNGGDYIGINSLRIVYKVLSCSDATHLTIDANLPSTVSGSTFQRSPQMPSACSPSSALYCEGSGDRALINTTTGAFGHYYNITGDSTYLTYGNELFSAAYGGAADGPGGSEPPGGPSADGTIAQNYIDALNPCNVSAPPCGGYGLSAYNVYGKGFGQGSGTGGASAFLGYSTIPIADNIVNVAVNLKLTDVPNATKVILTTTLPDGTSSDVTCTSFPCNISVNTRQANYHLMQVKYENDADKVLAEGSIQPIRVN